MELNLNGLESEFENLIQLVSNVTDAFTAALFILENESLTFSAYHTLSRNFLHNIEIPIGHGIVGWVAKQGQAVNISHFSQDAQKLKFYDQDEQIKSFMAVPIKFEGKITGVLAVDSKNQYVFTEKVQKILTDFSSQFAYLIERLKEHRRVKNRLRHFDLLSKTCTDLQFAGNLSEVLGTLNGWLPKMMSYDHMLLAVRNTDDNKFQLLIPPGGRGTSLIRTKINLDQGYFGKIIKSKQPLINQNVKDFSFQQVTGTDFEGPTFSDIQSFTGIPLTVFSNVVGVIALLGGEKEQFNDDNQATLDLLGPLIGSLVTGIYFRSRNKMSSFQDPITGTGNHRYVIEKIHSFFSGETGEDLSFSIIWLTVDNFSQMLDVYSIDFIDEFLVKFTQFLEMIVGNSGIIGKYYANQFLLFFPHATEADSKSWGKRIYDLFKAKSFFVAKTNIEIRVKMGCSTYPSDGKTVEDLVKCAIKSLWKIWDDPDQWIGVYGEIFSQQRKISWL